jgi:hypothetical protein
MSGKIFERVVAAAIIGNAGLLIAGLAVDGDEELLEHCHDAFVAFFAVELLIRLRHGLGFFRSRWNCFDALVIVASCLPLLGLDAGLLRVARAARLIHLGRHMAHLLPHLRLIRFIAPAKLAAAACAAMVLVMGAAGTARADDDPTVTQEICGTYNLGVPQDQIPVDLQRNDGRWNTWTSQQRTNQTILGGACG